MPPEDQAGLTASDVRRWLHGLKLFHAVRFAVMSAVVGATILSVNDYPQCTPEHPCGTSPPGTWMMALVIASAVLLVGAPGLGCLSALALGVLGAGYDPALSARGWWAAEAALSMVAFVLLLVIRVHQRQVAAAIERVITMSGGETATSGTRHGQDDATNPPTWGPRKSRAVLIGVAAAVGIVCMLFYQHPDDLYLPDGQALTGFASQLGLVFGPDDQMPWLSFAILAWLFAAAAALRPARVWWAQRRPQDGDLRGILVSTRWPRPDDDAEISAADGSGLRLSVLRSVNVAARFLAQHAEDWTQPELAAVTGQLWYGGVVQLRALDGEALADAIVGLPQLTLLGSWHAAPPPAPFEDENLTVDGDDHELADSRAPLVIDGDAEAGAPTPFAAYDGSHRLIRWTLWFYFVLAVGTVGLVVTGVLRSDSEWWALVILPGIVLLCLVPFLPHLARAHVAVSEDGVTVVNSLSTYQIPWGAIHNVQLKLARGLWQRQVQSVPEEDFQLVFNTTYGIIKAEVPLGRDSPSGGMTELLLRIVDFRDRTRVTDGHPATAVKVTGAAAHSRRARRWGSGR